MLITTIAMRKKNGLLALALEGNIITSDYAHSFSLVASKNHKGTTIWIDRK